MPRAAVAEDERAGEQIYRQMCARCHGASGEGSKEYAKPLAATVLWLSLPD